MKNMKIKPTVAIAITTTFGVFSATVTSAANACIHSEQSVRSSNFEAHLESHNQHSSTSEFKDKILENDYEIVPENPSASSQVIDSNPSTHAKNPTFFQDSWKEDSAYELARVRDKVSNMGQSVD